jgi:hypothetical protein
VVDNFAAFDNLHAVSISYAVDVGPRRFRIPASAVSVDKTRGGMARDAALPVRSGEIGGKCRVFACDDRNQRPGKGQGIL